MENEHFQFIQKLSNPRLNGRVPGTKGHEAARELILEQFKKLPLTPLPDGEWEQTYLAFNGITGRNLLAKKEGAGEKWLLLGAHYDHINNCPGANDNAASVGILLSVLDSLKTANLKLTIILAIFDMEETRYFMTNSMGSFQFYRQFQKKLEDGSFLGAFILDMCGHEVPVKSRENSLFVIGADSSPVLSKSIDAAQNQEKNLQVFRLGSRRLFHLSDNWIFEMKRKPVLLFTCGPYKHYHTREDTFEKLNRKKLSQIASMIKQCILALNSELSPAGFSNHQPFIRKSEAAELGRFLETELDTRHNLDMITQIVWKELSKGEKQSLDKMKAAMKAMRVL